MSERLQALEDDVDVLHGGRQVEDPFERGRTYEQRLSDHLVPEMTKWLKAAGATQTWGGQLFPLAVNSHAYGGTRMGSDPATSVVDKWLEVHHRPKHGSWLNVAEIELSVLERQCLRQRFPDQEHLGRATGAWEDRRNSAEATINWQFKTADARIKLKRLYPSFDV